MDYYYTSDERLKAESQVYVQKFSKYVSANDLSTTDRIAFSDWIKSQKSNIVLYVFQNQVLQYDSLYFSDDEKAYGSQPETEYDRRNSYPVQFKNGTGNVSIYGYYFSHYYNLAYMIEILLSTILFMSIVLFGIRRGIKYLRIINNEIHILEGGSLDYPMTIKGYDEFAMIAESIEELRKAFLNRLERIDHLQKESRNLATEMSHDIRTPLTSLIMYLEFARNSPENLGIETREQIESAYHKALQLKKRTDNLFLYFLLDKEKEADLETISVRESIYDVLSDITAVLRSEGFQVLVNTGPTDVMITVDMDNIGRVFDNLLSNIMKYADQEQKIKLLTYTEENHFVICVENKLKINNESVESYKLGEKIIYKIMNRMVGQFSSSRDHENYKIMLKFKINQTYLRRE
jgi:signal transduction histidine kinase